MPKTDGDITRTRILEVAENLFSINGFDGTGLENIAKTAGINKATIYYHFKDKQDIIVSLFDNILTDLHIHIQKATTPDDSIKELIKKEITYIRNKRKILSVMFMEALKDNNLNNYLFHCSQVIIKNEIGEVEIKDEDTKQRVLIHEFFTGIMPMITFVIFEERWCNYFECDKETAIDKFVDIFEKSHLQSHIV